MNVTNQLSLQLLNLVFELSSLICKLIDGFFNFLFLPIHVFVQLVDGLVVGL